jgi:hypothetical protein
MTIQIKTLRTVPDPLTMTPSDLGDAMRQRAGILKAKLPFDLAQAVDILLNMAAQVDAMSEELVTDDGKADLVADLYRLDELLPD